MSFPAGVYDCPAEVTFVNDYRERLLRRELNRDTPTSPTPPNIAAAVQPKNEAPQAWPNDATSTVVLSNGDADTGHGYFFTMGLIFVPGEATPELPNTGSNSTFSAGLGSLLAIAGLAIFVMGRRRIRRPGSFYCSPRLASRLFWWRRMVPGAKLSLRMRRGPRFELLMPPLHPRTDWCDCLHSCTCNGS